VARMEKMNQAMTTGSGPREKSDSFLPNFCAIRTVFAVVITAELLAIVLALVSGATLSRFVEYLSVYSLFIQWVVLVGSGVLCLLRRRLQRLSDGAVGLVVWLLLILITAVVGELSLFILDYVLGPGGHFFFLLRNLGIAAIVMALLLRYLYLQGLWRRQVVAESQARFQALQSRIRPHFLFNSMNTIASLTRTQPEMAEEVVHDLADLFRATLADAGRLSDLGRELELARGYLRIEEQRLGERLRVEWDLEGVPLEAAVPGLILQPLLENAVYHGIEPATEPGTIYVVGRYRRHRVNLSIRNTLPQGGGAVRREGNRLALENIRQRLEAVFGEDAGLVVSEVDGEHQVRVFFPHPWRE
jgi:two-component system sensor histidine kinase AlgZ